jgi:hypothetical protein
MKTFLTFFALLLTIGVFAQPPGKGDDKRKDQIKAQKIAFISSQLSLTSKEAEVFWPVYNDYESAIEDVRNERRKIHKVLRDIDVLSDDEAYANTQKLFELDAKEGEIRKEYLAKFAKVLDKKKAALVFAAEVRFHKELLKKIKNGNDQAPGHDGPPRGPH